MDLKEAMESLDWAARESERERCAKIAEGYAINAQRRAAIHDNEEAKRAALDKMEAALDIAASIRETVEQKQKPKPRSFSTAHGDGAEDKEPSTGNGNACTRLSPLDDEGSPDGQEPQS